MGKVFTISGDEYASELRRQGYVHISGALTREYLGILRRQTQDYLNRGKLAGFAIGDKQQALYDFPHPENYREFREVISAICGVNPDRLVISERHIKEYEAKADPRPLAHKDRFASQFSVGFSVTVPRGSTLVIYPETDLEPNPFPSSTELRNSYAFGRSPEQVLEKARRVEIQDGPGDLIVFHGNSMWHLRENAANTQMIYFKVNVFNCDTLGEDPETPAVTERSRASTVLPENELENAIPQWGRRLDHLVKRLGRDGRETLGLVIAGRPLLRLEEAEFRALRLVDGKRRFGAIAREVGGFDVLVRLVNLGAVDIG